MHLCRRGVILYMRGARCALRGLGNSCGRMSHNSCVATGLGSRPPRLLRGEGGGGSKARRAGSMTDTVHPTPAGGHGHDEETRRDFLTLAATAISTVGA